MAVTIKEIAKRAGVDHSTVSRVLNKKSSYAGKETREKILQVAKELDYQPNYLASALRSGKRMCIGVAGTGHLEDINNIGNTGFYSGIGKVAEENNYYLMFIPQSSEGHGPHSFHQSLHRACRSRVFDGLIIIIYSDTYDRFVGSTMPFLMEEQIPFVAIDFSSHQFPCSSAGVNAQAAGYQAAGHLAEQGYHEIALVNNGSRFSQDLLEGYTQAAKEHQLPIRDIRVGSSVVTAVDFYQQARDLIDQNNQADAFITIRPSHASGLARALTEQGRRIPDDTGIVALGNTLPDEVFLTGITTIDTKTKQRGEQAARLLFKQLEGKIGPQAFVAEPELIIRRSSVKQ